MVGKKVIITAVRQPVLEASNKCVEMARIIKSEPSMAKDAKLLKIVLRLAEGYDALFIHLRDNYEWETT